MINIRKATPADAEQCSTVLCESITQLCRLDHRDDTSIIASWTRNKTPETIERWIRSSENIIYVAEIESAIVAVGGIDDDVSITLNYVSPQHRFHGISKAMLSHLENRLRDRQVRQARLLSTLTARDFYGDAGWTITGEIETFAQMMGYTMQKQLAVDPDPGASGQTVVVDGHVNNAPPRRIK